MEPKAKKGKEETTDKIDVLRSTDKQSGESVEPVLKKTSGGHQWTMVVAGRPATRDRSTELSSVTFTAAVAGFLTTSVICLLKMQTSTLMKLEIETVCTAHNCL